jgi:hypothetical protein
MARHDHPCDVSETSEVPSLPRDFRDLLFGFIDEQVEFLVIGGHAVTRHGYLRATFDLDVLVRPSAENAKRVFDALAKFGARLATHGATTADFAKTGTVYQMGVPPCRIDVLTSIAGVTFDEAWASKVAGEIVGRTISFIGREALIRNKRAAGRPKDIVDADHLEGR